MSSKRSFNSFKSEHSIDFTFNCSPAIIVECIIIAFILYGHNKSIAWSIVTFMLSILLYQIPFLKGILSVSFSLIAAIAIHTLFEPLYPATIACLISLWSFIVFNTAHRLSGSMIDIREYGYSMSIVEMVLISMFLHYYYHLIVLSVIVFIFLFLATFVPIVNIIELISLAFFAAYAYFSVICNTLPLKYALIYSIIIFIYFGIYYTFVGKRIWRHSSFIHSHNSTNHAEQEETKQESKEEEQSNTNSDNLSNSERQIIYFNGVTDNASLKKRYHELLKIYHPDNQNGDTETVQRIQEEYEYLEHTFN